jgi:hypothetical protein
MNTKIYNVIVGPIHASEYDGGDCYDDEWVILALVEQPNGALEEEEIVLDTFDEAYEIVKHFKSQIIPFEIELD